MVTQKAADSVAGLGTLADPIIHALAVEVHDGAGELSGLHDGLSRAIGETMAVVLAAGMRPQLTLNPLTSVETMTTYIVAVTNGEAADGSPEYLSLFAVGMALFLITLGLNILSGLVLRRYREVYQ